MNQSSKLLVVLAISTVLLVSAVSLGSDESTAETTTDVSNSEEFYSALSHGGNVRLVSDFSIDNESVDESLAQHIDGVSVILDLNDHNVTNVGIIVGNGGSLTITGIGSLEGGYPMGCPIIVDLGGTVTIYSGTIIGGDGASGILVDKGELIVYGGYFKTLGPYNGVYFVLNKQDRTDSKITVYGGEFENYDPSNSKTENPDQNFVAEGFTIYKNGNNFIVGKESHVDSQSGMIDATESNSAVVDDVQSDSVTVNLSSGISVSIQTANKMESLFINVDSTTDNHGIDYAVSSFDVRIETGETDLINVSYNLPALISNGFHPVVYYVEDGVIIEKIEDAIYSNGYVSFSTNHNSTYVIAEEPNSQIDEEDGLPPFIPQQAVGDDNTTLYIACCAAAAVVALLAIIIVMSERKR